MKIFRVLLICCALIFFTWGATYAQNKATIKLPHLQGDPGTTINVPIKVSTDSSIGIAQFVIEYDKNVISFDKDVQNVYLGADIPSGFSISNVNDGLPFEPTSPGTNENVLIQVNGGGSNSFSGNNLEVAVIEFEVVSSGGETSPLNFDEGSTKTYLSTISLYDIAGSEINFDNGNLEIVMENTPPTASNLTITPADPKTGDDLVGSYDYNDADSDPEGSTEIRWYKDGVQQSAYDDVLTVPASATAKGEEWYFTVKPHDGKEFGDLATSATMTIGNTAPEVSNVTLSPTEPLTVDDLVGSYDYSDADADPDGSTEIRWYKDGVHQAAYDDQLTIPSSETNSGQEWYFTIKPHDGEAFGNLVESNHVKLNNIPIASNATITPSSPVTTDNLVGSYDYFDNDGDPEGSTQIRWHKNGNLQSAYNDQLTVPSSATAKGEEWYFTVMAHDGKEYGSMDEANNVIIGNTAPVASNLTISPASPLDADDLVGSYNYSDADGDDESDSEIRWYKDGVMQSAYNDVLTVPASATATGEKWYLTVKPNDGTGFGELQTSSTVTIGASNTPPTATNLAITPADPKTDDDLVGSYDYNDADGDPEGSTEIRWYKNGALQSDYNDVLTVPSSATAKDEEWYFTVKSHDGKEFGDLETSGTETIGNTVPVASNLTISPTSPLDTDDLVGSYNYSDADGDDESGSEIRWYKNDALQSDYNDVLTVPSSATVAGEEWYFTVKPNDGTDFGELQTSATVTISEAPTYTLTVNIDPGGSGTVTKDPDKESYNPGEELTLTAIPDGGYEFDHWSGDASGTDPVVTITMDSDKEVTAHFKLITAINKMHIKEIVVIKQKFSNFARGKAEVLIIDAYNNPVEGTTVTGEWSRGATDVDMVNTESDGWETTYSNWNVKTSRWGEPEFTFTVINVEKEGWIYDTEANVATWNSTDGKESEYFAENLNLNELDLEVAIKMAWNNPNPFNSSTTISFIVPQASHAKVEIYNILGKRIATLLDRHVEAGVSSVIWNAKNENGIDVTSGTYFYRISFDDDQPLIRKILFLK